MHFLVPANSKQLIDRAGWFKHPVARQLAKEKGVDFGFELKGEPETIKKAPPLYWAYHLPDYFATEWYYHSENRQKLISGISHLNNLKPDYICFHGTHLWWQPPAKERIHRYANRSEPEEYLKVLDSNIELIKQIKKTLPDIHLMIENYPLYMCYSKDNRFLPITYLYTGTGRLFDLLYFKKKTSIDILLDVEHLILTLNFLNRQKNYADLPVEKVKDNRRVTKIFGFVLEKDVIPYVEEPIKLEDVIKKIGSKNYHVTGSIQDVIPGKKILTHEPIKVDDKIFRKNLRLILAEKPATILIETANSTVNPCWHYLRPNETELSFYNLCEIFLEEL